MADLLLTFGVSSTGAKKTIRLRSAASGLDGTTVQSKMNDIVSQNVLTVKGTPIDQALRAVVRDEIDNVLFDTAG